MRAQINTWLQQRISANQKSVDERHVFISRAKILQQYPAVAWIAPLTFVFIALIAQILLSDLVHEKSFILIYPAIALGALFGNRYANIIASVVALVGSIFSNYPIQFTADNIFGYAVFMLSVLAISVLSDIVLQTDLIHEKNFNRKIETLLNTLPIFAGVQSIEGKVILVNEVACFAVGITPDQVLGHYFWECPWWDGLPETHQKLKQALEKAKKGTAQNFETPYVAISNGQRIEGWVSFSMIPVMNQNGIVDSITTTGYDISEEKKTLEKLKASEKRFRKISAFLPQLVWTATAEGTVDYFNDRISQYQILKKTNGIFQWHPMIHKDDLEKTAHAWQNAVTNKTEYQFEHRLKMADGSFRWHLTRGIPLVDDNNQVECWFGTSTDIHCQILIQAELKAAKEEAERANHLKSAFVANMSHEIRTPLGAIMGFTDLLRDPDLPKDEHLNYINIVKKNGEQLSEIINDILDLSKIEAGHLSFEYHLINPTDIANDVISLLKIKADEKTLDLLLTIEESAPKQIVTDPLRLRQILMNVVGNAIKFTSTGTIKIKVACHPVNQDDLCFEVCDTGIGIPKDAREKIFQAFIQADGNSTRRFGGTGLGLALSRELARKLGGDIEVKDSDEGKGSTFLIHVANRTEGQTIVRTPQSEVKAKVTIKKDALKDFKILIIDDSADNRQLISLYLAKQGAQLDFSENGLEGYRKAISHEFDIVLMDIQMPVMDGYTATIKLREAGYQKPIIALTAHAMSEVRTKCLNVGCNDHLTKPIKKTELIQALLRWAPKGRAETMADL